MSRQATWSDYYAANDGREPRRALLDVLANEDVPGRAVDLGCGSGIDTLAMLRRGWHVLAIDAEREAIDRLEARLPSDLTGLLETRVSRMEDAELPASDLVHASYSLFFCEPARFPEVWRRIGAALTGGGSFVGELLGDRDTWAPEDDISAFTEAEARALFDGWSVERFDEEDNDGEACSGPKHWHVFHVVARRPALGRSGDRPA
jgi:SAM-dependent methyltransferase